MRFFTFTTLLAAALVSAIVAVPFLPAAKVRSDSFRLEVRVTSNTTGYLQVFYDDGSGIREEMSARANVTPTASPVSLQLPLPPGAYRAWRIDPLEHGGTIAIHSLRIVTRDGRVVKQLPLENLQPVQQIETLRRAAEGVEVVINAQSNDPQLVLPFSTPVQVRSSTTDYLRESGRPVLLVFLALAAGLFLLDRAAGLRAGFGQWTSRLTLEPGRAVSIVAAFSVIASAYPIVFLGKSYVSPNLGTALLYDTFPTLPGDKSADVADVKLSDIGAVMWQHVPFSMMQHRALAQGELPLWNRYNALGVPLLAQGQSMFGDPLHLFVVAANGAAWAWDIKYLVAKWLFATGLGLIVLAALRPWSFDSAPGKPGATPVSSGTLAAAVIVALATPFIGFFLYRINHPAFFSLCYAPWPLYCIIRLAQAARRRAVAGWAAGLIVANVALMNSGTVKEAYMLLVCVNFTGGCVVLASPLPWRTKVMRLFELAWAGGIFALLTAPIWATFLQTLKNAYTGYNAATAYQIQPTLLLGLFDEIFYRPLMEQNRVYAPSLNFLLLLGVLYFLATLRLQFANRIAMAIAASALLPLSLAFGLISPQWIVTLPFLGNVAHLDNTFSCVLVVLLSVVAGLGYATAAQRLGTREGRGDLVIAGLLLGALVFGWIAFRQAAHRPILGTTFSVHPPGKVLPIAPFIWDYLKALLVAAIVLAVLVHRSLARRTFSPARGLLIALCVIMLLWRHGLHASTIGFEDFTARPTVRADFHARSEAMEYARAAQAREPGRGFGFQGNFFPGWTGVYGLETVHGPDALVNPWVRELVGSSGVERIWDWRIYVEPETLAKARPFLDALNVRFYFDLHTRNPLLTQSLTFAKAADLDVYESPTAWPRAFFTDRIDVYDHPADLVEKFRAAAGRPFAAVQRTDSPSATAVAHLSHDAGARNVAPATEYRLKENSTSFHVHASGPGVAVLTEALWPGDFRADINGRKASIVRVNHAFKGVVVDTAGDYTVTFSYRPKNYPRNLALCGTGAVLLAASLVLALQSERRRRA